jgi:hypothetical protein
MAKTTDKASKTDGRNMGDDPNKILANDGIPNLDEMVEDTIGFAPYWNPEEGKRFYGCVVARDERQAEFTRYVVQNMGGPLDCKKGPADNAETVTVETGGRFTISSYVQLYEAFDFYLECGASGTPIPFVLTAVEKVKGGQGSVWNYSIKMTPAVKNQITKLRLSRGANGVAKSLPAGAGAGAALPEAS